MSDVVALVRLPDEDVTYLTTRMAQSGKGLGELITWIVREVIEDDRRAHAGEDAA